MTGSVPAPLVRSALFVPASSERFLRSAERCAADALILDLEDGVADSSRADARRTANAFISARPEHGSPMIFARINPLTAGQVDADLDAVVHPALGAVLLPKLSGPEDVVELDRKLSWHEGKGGLCHGSIRIWPLIETPAAISHVDSIAIASDRVAFLGGAIADGGDLVSSLRIEVGGDGSESLYLRSRLLIAARSAGIANPITGLCTDLDDLDGLEHAALAGRRLGYEGMMVIHPSHVPIVNRVFSPSAEAVTDARRVLEVLDAADQDGSGTVRLDGRMIDAAMGESARLVVERDARVRTMQPQDGDR